MFYVNGTLTCQMRGRVPVGGCIKVPGTGGFVFFHKRVEAVAWYDEGSFFVPMMMKNRHQNAALKFGMMEPIVFCDRIWNKRHGQPVFVLTDKGLPRTWL